MTNYMDVTAEANSSMSTTDHIIHNTVHSTIKNQDNNINKTTQKKYTDRIPKMKTKTRSRRNNKNGNKNNGNKKNTDYNDMKNKWAQTQATMNRYTNENNILQNKNNKYKKDLIRLKSENDNLKSELELERTTKESLLLNHQNLKTNYNKLLQNNTELIREKKQLHEELQLKQTVHDQETKQKNELQNEKERLEQIISENESDIAALKYKIKGLQSQIQIVNDQKHELQNQKTEMVNLVSSLTENMNLSASKMYKNNTNKLENGDDDEWDTSDNENDENENPDKADGAPTYIPNHALKFQSYHTQTLNLFIDGDALNLTTAQPDQKHKTPNGHFQIMEFNSEKVQKALSDLTEFFDKKPSPLFNQLVSVIKSNRNPNASALRGKIMSFVANYSTKGSSLVASHGNKYPLIQHPILNDLTESAIHAIRAVANHGQIFWYYSVNTPIPNKMSTTLQMLKQFKSDESLLLYSPYQLKYGIQALTDDGKPEGPYHRINLQNGEHTVAITNGANFKLDIFKPKQIIIGKEKLYVAILMVIGYDEEKKLFNKQSDILKRDAFIKAMFDPIEEEESHEQESENNPDNVFAVLQQQNDNTNNRRGRRRGNNNRYHILVLNKHNTNKNINNKQIKRDITSIKNHYKLSTLNNHIITFIFIDDNISTNHNIYQFIFQILKYINHHKFNDNYQMITQINNTSKRSLQIIFTITENWYWSHKSYLILRTSHHHTIKIRKKKKQIKKKFLQSVIQKISMVLEIVNDKTSNIKLNSKNTIKINDSKIPKKVINSCYIYFLFLFLIQNVFVSQNSNLNLIPI